MAVEMGSGGERVPRFLGVCRLAEDSVAVASSDATIKYFRFLPTAAHPDTVLRSVLLEGEVELDPEAPRPVFCISPVPFCATPNECDVALTVSGDAGGRIFVVERMRRVHALEAAVIAQCKVEDCAVNAISSVHQRGGDEQRAAYYQTEDEKGLRSTWEVAAITDSGTVHLLSITLRWGIINSGGEQRYHTISCMVAPLFRYSIGITAGRGIVWNSLQDHIIAACEERVVRFCRVFHSEGKEQDKSNNTMRLLQSVRERRSNIRSISGICARAVDSVIVENIKPHHHGYEVVVVGQGVEVLYI